MNDSEKLEKVRALFFENMGIAIDSLAGFRIRIIMTNKEFDEFKALLGPEPVDPKYLVTLSEEMEIEKHNPEPTPPKVPKQWNDFSTIKIPYVKVNRNKITFCIQEGPINEVGENGCQIDALGEVWLSIIQSFNKKYPCRENSLTTTKIEEALMWQKKRKEIRQKRGVEGYDKQ